MKQPTELQLRAKEFESLLISHSEKDKDIRDFLGLIDPWFKKIALGEITSPCAGYDLDVYFFHTDFSPLFERYHVSDLSRAAADFSQALRGW